MFSVGVCVCVWEGARWPDRGPECLWKLTKDLGNWTHAALCISHPLLLSPYTHTHTQHTFTTKVTRTVTCIVHSDFQTDFKAPSLNCGHCGLSRRRPLTSTWVLLHSSCVCVGVVAILGLFSVLNGCSYEKVAAHPQCSSRASDL